jgi:SPP1 family predicted phage head-tail adaptor
MRAGKKNRRIKIEQLSSTRSDTGVKTEVWTLYKTVWADVSDKTATENFGADQYTTKIGTLFKIDFIDGLNPKDYRIIYRNRVYDIDGVKELGINEAMEVMAEAQY